MIIIWIKDLNYVTGHVFIFNSSLIISLIKFVKTEGFLCLSIPYTESVYNMIVVTNYRCIVRNCNN